jgi:hypothetical protein
VTDSHTCGGYDPFCTPETVARANWYGVDGVPDVHVDGKYHTVAVGSCIDAYQSYRNWFDRRMSETGRVSPVSIVGSYSVSGADITMRATLTLVDSVPQTEVQATFFMAENQCYYNATTSFDHITRKIWSQPVTLANVGDHVTVQTTFAAGAAWNMENVEASAILQKTSSDKEIIQAARLPLLTDFEVALPYRVKSLPLGSSDALFPVVIRNTNVGQDVLTLSLENAFGWPASFQIAGDPAWHTDPLAVPLALGDSIEVTIKVTTDDLMRIGAGTFRCQSGTTGRVEPAGLRVFNKSPAILLVDDDGTQTMELPFTEALTQLAYLYDNWDVVNGHGGASPHLVDMLGFDAIIWQTGTTSAGELLNGSDQNRLMDYLNSGGTLYLDSPALLVNVALPNTFLTGYLGIASCTTSTGGDAAIGVDGDPITNGMVLSLTFAPGENQIATVNPTATASVIFNSDLGHPAALRNLLAGGSKTVYSSILQEAISQSDPDPDNSRTCIQRILSWLLPDPTAVSDQSAAGTRVLLTGRPNPFGSSTELSFYLAGSGQVRLSMVDAAGRLVRTLVDGNLNPGLHRLQWDGVDDAGHGVPSGIYFVRLKSTGGENFQKLVLMK